MTKINIKNLEKGIIIDFKHSYKNSCKIVCNNKFSKFILKYLKIDLVLE